LNRKYEFDGVVIEVAVPQYLGSFLSLLADTIHALPGEKRLVVVIPPYIEGYPSAEVSIFEKPLIAGLILSECACRLFLSHDIRS
jgi:hypothetical protein